MAVGLLPGEGSQSVTTRYRALLDSLGGGPREAHGQIVAAMLTGDLAPLEAWLDQRHGPGCFTRLFRAPSYDQDTEQNR